jgi:hypothetical protein
VTRLSPVLDGAGIDDVELQAMRLDGEVFRLAAAWAPVDVPITPALRAGAVMAERSPRLVAELRTAAWIWGAVPVLPRPVELCSDVRARARVRPGADAVVREVVLDDDEVVRIGGAAVTSPARTLADLARTGVADDPTLAELAALTGVRPEAVRELLLRRTAAGRPRALETVERALVSRC